MDCIWQLVPWEKKISTLKKALKESSLHVRAVWKLRQLAKDPTHINKTWQRIHSLALAWSERNSGKRHAWYFGTEVLSEMQKGEAGNIEPRARARIRDVCSKQVHTPLTDQSAILRRKRVSPVAGSEWHGWISIAWVAKVKLQPNFRQTGRDSCQLADVMKVWQRAKSDGQSGRSLVERFGSHIRQYEPGTINYGYRRGITSSTQVPCCIVSGYEGE